MKRIRSIIGSIAWWADGICHRVIDWAEGIDSDAEASNFIRWLKGEE